MKLIFTLLAIASALTGLVSAQGVAGSIPTCAQPCINQFTSNGGSEIAGCNRIDAACICSNKDFLGGIACCLVDKCDAEDQQKATEYALAFCKANQVTGLPTAVSCSSTVTATATAATGTSTSTGSAAATITSSGSSTTSSASVSPNAASTTSSGTSSTTANAAPTNVARIGAGIMGGLVAVAALL